MRVAPIHNNFTAGELSPKLSARIDLVKYDNGLKTCQNCVIQPQGGVSRRTGFEYIADAKNSTSDVRLIPFIFSETQAYVLEFGDQYIRVFMDGGQVVNGSTPVEISTSYAESDLPLLKYAQTADTLYIVHPDHPPAKLTRSSHTNWSLTDINFNPPATNIHDWTNAVTLTPGQITGNDVTFDADSAIFQNGDVDRQIIFGSSRAIITAYNTTTRVTADIIDDWPDLDPMPPGDWALRGTPTGYIVPRTMNPIGAISRVQSEYNVFRSEDVGRYISCHDGFLKITKYVAADDVYGEILKEFSSVSTATDWTLESSDWNATDGYPKCVAFFDDRLFFGGSPSYPSSVWGSVVGDYENYTPGVEDADAINTSLLSGKVDTIRWMIGAKKLIIGTTGAEWWMSGGTGADEVITPANKMARAETTFGSVDRQPININNRIIFIQKPGKSIREFNYNFGTDAYEGNDLSVLAEHMTWTYGIDEIAYQQTPNKIIWARRSDGVLLGATFMPEHEVIGWHRHITDGEFESIAVIPGDTEDELWAAVKRTVDGSEARYVERLKTTDWMYTYNQTEATATEIVEKTWGERDADDYTGEIDAGLREVSPNTNYSTAEMKIGNDGDKCRHAIKFSVREQIPGATIRRATLYVRMYSYTVGAGDCEVYRLLQDWEEGQLTWNNRLTGTAWNTAGADAAADADDDGAFDRWTTAEDSESVPGAVPRWISLDVTNLVQKWVNGTAREYGVILILSNEAGAGINFCAYSDDYGDQQYRPYLKISYAPYPSTVEQEYTNENEAFYVDCGLTYRERGEISNINQTSPVSMTVDNTVTDGDQVFLSRISGAVELNNNTYTVANAMNFASGTDFDLVDENGYDIDGRGYQAYESGGYADKLATVISSLDHLEGETVAILADGEAVDEQEVSGGKITLDEAAHEVHAGLPYTPVIETLRIEAGAPDGTAQGRIKKIHRLNARYLFTKNFKIGPDEDTLEEVETDMSACDEDIERVFPGGHNDEGRIYITQDEPQPMTILGIFPIVNTND